MMILGTLGEIEGHAWTLWIKIRLDTEVSDRIVCG
jgi:hypothetical protein